MPLKILQFSDLHIGNEYFTNDDFIAKTSSALRKNISTNNSENIIDVIVITGDVFDAISFSNEGEYKSKIKQAVELFEGLLEKFNEQLKTKLEKKDFIFIPGNHECNENNDDNPFNRYEEFLTAFYKDIPKNYNKKYWSTYHLFKEEKVILVGFNSVGFNKEKSERYGTISASQLNDSCFKIDEEKNKEEYKIVVMLHHHFYLIEERNQEIDKSTLHNHTEFLKNFSGYNLEVILHGHKHTTTNRRIITNTSMAQADNIVNVIGCGASNKKDTSYNSFNYIEIYKLEDSLDLRLTEFNYESSIYEAKKTIELPISSFERKQINLLRILSRLSDISIDYNALKELDTVTKANELIEIMDKTVCVLNDVSNKIEKDNKIAFYLIIPIHYRCAKKIEDSFLKQIKEFIDKYALSDFTKDQLLQLYILLETENIYDAYKEYDELKRMNLSDKGKQYLSFLMVSFYICELYLTIVMRAEEFFNVKIKDKSNIIFEKGVLREEIAGNTIDFICEEDKRSIRVEVKCLTANAHKVTTLIVKEFDLLLSKFDEDFANNGIKIYYIIPDIKKEKNTNSKLINNYSFNAYIPSLIPLLAGENLYAKKETFARELIQNSVDAIKVREKMDNNFYGVEDGVIKIELGENNGKKYFEIVDNGTGMNLHVLERYFTSIGRSYYKSKEFAELNIAYSPISMFGIGFLSCFVVGKRVEVITKYYKNQDEQNESYILEIPNYDGCFFIEEGNKDEIGTKIRIYEDKDKIGYFQENEIIKYINENILNIPYKLKIKDAINHVDNSIDKFNMFEKIAKITKENKLLFYLPLKKEDKEIIFDPEKFYSDKSYRCENKYGLYFYIPDDSVFKERKISFNNAGIDVNLSNRIKFIEKLKLKKENIFDIYINFDSEMLEMEVSRDEIKNILEDKIYLSNYENKLDNQIHCYLKNNYKDNLPFYIIHKLNNKEFGLNKLNIMVDNEDLIIKYEKENEEINIHLLESSNSSLIENSKSFIDLMERKKIYEQFYINKENDDLLYKVESNYSKNPYNKSSDSAFHYALRMASIISREMNIQSRLDRDINRYSSLIEKIVSTLISRKFNDSRLSRYLVTSGRVSKMDKSILLDDEYIGMLFLFLYDNAFGRNKLGSSNVIDVYFMEYFFKVALILNFTIIDFKKGMRFNLEKAYMKIQGKLEDK